MTMTTAIVRFRASHPLLLSAVLALAACGSSAPRGGTGGSDDLGGESGQGGTAGSETGGSSGSGGKGGTSGKGGSSGSGGQSGTAGSGGDTGGTSGGGTGGDTGGQGGAAGSGTGGESGTGGGDDAGSGAADAMSGNGTITGNGCAGGACLNPDCKAMGTPANPGTFPSIGFETHPGYIPNDVLIPTFDDVPDRPYTSADGQLYKNFGAGNWTKQMLDWLDQNNLHFDFFINTANFCYLDKNPGCVETVTRILKTQNAANHTVHHIHMGSNAAYNPTNMFDSGCRAAGKGGTKLVCEDEISGVEQVIQTLSNGGINHLTRFRAPYGEPFQAGGGAVGEIQGVVSKFAVHVGWAMESGDADHDTDGNSQDFVKAVTSQIGTAKGGGSYGVILMHGTYPWSMKELKGLFDPNTGYIKTHGFRLGTVEDAVCWKYGRHSWELISQITGKTVGAN